MYITNYPVYPFGVGNSSTSLVLGYMDRINVGDIITCVNQVNISKTPIEKGNSLI